MDPINIGILGAGRIAGVMADTLVRMEGVKLHAVAARDLERAKALAQRYGAAKAYGSYAEMLADPKVQLVYVATTHSHHYAQVKDCLEHGKHVLCEKAFTANAKQAEEIVALSRKKGLLLAEALWTRYQPFRHTVNDLAFGGAIGEPTFLAASLGANVQHKPRIYEPSLGGGALLDLGVYPLNFAFMVFGTDVAKITSACVKYPTGVDAQITMTIAFASGKMASLFSTIMVVSDKAGTIYGDKGYIVVDNINNPNSAQVFDTDRRLRAVHYRPPVISGYEYEVEAAVRAIRAGEVECPEMPHAETLRIMRILDELRTEWGVEIPG